jgi:cytoskeletal protein CcmA (bactofilin family)
MKHVFGAVLVVLLVLISLPLIGVGDFVTDRELTIQPGETYQGGLFISSPGVVTIEEGARVNGPIFMGSGVLNVGGEVSGGIFSLSGEVHLAPTATVKGHVTVTSVPFESDTGAQIENNLAADVSGWLGGPVGTALVMLTLTGYLFYWSKVHALILDRSETGKALRAQVLTLRNLAYAGIILAATVLAVAAARLAGLESLPGTWALALGAFGGALFALMLFDPAGRAVLAVPTAAVLVAGLILAYQAVTGNWWTWAYAWALILPTSVGLGCMAKTQWSDDRQSAQEGRYYTVIGLAFFALGFVFFELLADAGGVVTLLVLIGLVALVAALLMLTRREPEARMPTGT